MDPNATPPKVFVSYSWTSDEYKARVRTIAERLASDGVHVILDQWDLKPGQDCYQFMERAVADIDVKHVLLMCDPRYAEKADQRTGGVGSEAMIISSEVYGRATQEKFIPVLMQRRDDGSDPLPVYLKSRFYIDFASEGQFAAEYDKLIRTIHTRPLSPRPQLGKIPERLLRSDAVSAKTHMLREALDAQDGNSRSFARAAKDLKDQILGDLRAQQIVAQPKEPIEEVIRSRILETKGIRDAAVAWMRALLESADDRTCEAELVQFFEEICSLAQWPEGVNFWSKRWPEHLEFIVRELWIFAVAMCIDERRWAVMKTVLDTKLCVATHGELKPYSYEILDCYLETQEETWNKKNKRGRISVLADLVHDRADDAKIDFLKMMQAEFCLCLRGIIGNERDVTPRWYPRTLVYRIHTSLAFPIFVRWRAGQMLEAIPALLKVSSREEIFAALNQMTPQQHRRYTFDYFGIPFMELAALDDLEARSAGE